MLKCIYLCIYVYNVYTFNIYSMVIGSTSMNILLLVLCRCVAFFREHEMTELEDCGFELFYAVNLFCDNTIYYNILLCMHRYSENLEDDLFGAFV